MALNLSKEKLALVPFSIEEEDLISFAEKLLGIRSKGNGKEEKIALSDLSDDSMSEEDGENETEGSEPLCLITEDPHRNFPTFSFSEKMKRRLHKAWNRAVIVKLLGKSIGYKLLLSILQSLWAKKRVISVINIGNGFFVVKLSNRDDYFNALTGGPWMLFDHYLTLRPWEPQFHPSSVSEGANDQQGTWKVVKPLRKKKGGNEKLAGTSGQQGKGSRFKVLAVEEEKGHTGEIKEVSKGNLGIQGSAMLVVVERPKLVADERRRDKRSRERSQKEESGSDLMKSAHVGKSCKDYGDGKRLGEPLAGLDPVGIKEMDSVVFTSQTHDPGDLHMVESLNGKFWANLDD
ncbi:hypothetical protein K1719_032033 [Acacia pycnantha]|nr:hypothetical protein K1719_032033 [Acacia pycnantha]